MTRRDPWANDREVARRDHQDAQHAALFPTFPAPTEAPPQAPALAPYPRTPWDHHQSVVAPQPVVVNVQAPAPAAGPNHVLHAVVSLLTGGLWLPVWFVLNRRARKAARRG